MPSQPDFSLRYPPIIEFGWGCRTRLPDVVRGLALGAAPRVFVICARTLVRTGRADELGRLCGGNVCGVSADVPHDPPLETVDRLAEALRETGAEVVLSAGGGSVMDAAKAAAILLPGNDSVWDYFSSGRSPDRRGLPHLALPTTAGTGAEITKNAVLTDAQKRVKKSLRSPYMVPTAALVDPELTLTLSPEVTAHSGLDALTQAIESYVSLKANAASRALAGAAVARLMTNLAAAVRNGADRGARTGAAEGSLLSAMAFSQSGLGAVHGLAHPLGVGLGLPHGLTCAVLLPYVMEWNLPACPDLFAELARAAGYASGEALVGAVRQLCCDLNVPAGFADHGLTTAHFPAILANCRGGSMETNPRPLSDADVTALLARLCAGE